MSTFPQAIVADSAVYANIKDRASLPLQDKAYMYNIRDYPLVSTTIFGKFGIGAIDSYAGPKPPKCKIVQKENTVYEVWFTPPVEASIKVNFAAGYTDADTSIVVSDASPVRKNSQLYVPTTGERPFVTAVDTTTNTLTVTRNSGNTNTGNTLPDGTVMMIMGSANKDGADPESGIQYKPQSIKNAAEIFRWEVEIGGSAEAERQHTGKPSIYNRLMKSQEAMKLIERSMIFGQTPLIASGASTDFYLTVAGGEHYFTRGLDQYITTNRFDAGGTLDEDEFDSYLSQMAEMTNFDECPMWAYAGPKMMHVVNGWAKDKKVVYEPVPTEYGARIATYMSTHGPVHFVREPEFTARYGTDALCYFFRPEYIEINPKQDRMLRLYPEVVSMKNSGKDKTVDAYIGEMGFYLHHEELHGVIERIG